MVTPPISSVEYSTVVCTITTDEIGSKQLILINTVQGNDHQLMTSNKVQDHETMQSSNEVGVQESRAKLLFSSPFNLS